MKRLMARVLYAAYCVSCISLIAGAAFAAEERKENILDRIVKTAISPIETILGPVTELERIIVTPSKMEEPLASSSVSVSVIDAGDFDRQKITTVKEALNTEAGLDIVQAGSFQGQTSLFTRGGNSNQTLIMVDGIKMYDPISPNGAYNLAHLTLDNVDRIEILRGPQSALYGSDAMSGVVNIISKKAEKPYLAASFDGGSFSTFNEKFAIGAATQGFHYSVAVSRLDTKGISQAQAKKNNQEHDPYDKTSIAARADYDIGDKASVGTTWHFLKAHYKLDQGADVDDDNAFEVDKENLITLYGNYKMFEFWEHSLRLGWMEMIRLNYDDDGPLFSWGSSSDFVRSKYFGRNFTLDYNSTLSILDFDRLIMGYAYNEEIGDYYSQNNYNGPMEISDMPKVFAREGDFYIENRINIADRLTSTQGMRVSHHSRVATHETYRIDASYMFATGTKVRGLVATGFKAPTLYQLFAPADAFFEGGNPDLNPEKSTSYEYGIDQYMFGEMLIASVTYFHTVYSNLIDSLYNPTGGAWGWGISEKYTNVGKAQVHGIETILHAKPCKNLKIRFGLTFQKTKDFQYDQDLARRPDSKFFIEAFWQVTDKLGIDAKVRYNGPMSDARSEVSSYKVKEYAVVDLAVNYDITKNFSGYVRFDNVFNKYYEEVRGFTMEPFAAYGGVKAKF